MAVRACYATCMIQRYRDGKEKLGLGKEDFVLALSKIMNTGVEQIREVYASSLRVDFKQSVAKWFQILDDKDHAPFVPASDEERVRPSTKGYLVSAWGVPNMIAYGADTSYSPSNVSISTRYIDTAVHSTSTPEQKFMKAARASRASRSSTAVQTS
eukprot:IDg1957t1